MSNHSTALAESMTKRPQAPRIQAPRLPGGNRTEKIQVSITPLEMEALLMVIDQRPRMVGRRKPSASDLAREALLLHPEIRAAMLRLSGRENGMEEDE